MYHQYLESSRICAARVNEKGCCFPVWGGGARNLITSAFKTGIQEIFYSSSYPHFCPFSTRSDQRQQPPPYILGNPSLPFAIGNPSPGTKHGYVYIYLFGTKVRIQTSQHHSRKSCPHSKVGRNYMNSFRKHSSTFAS